ncbi:ferritin-like domain-containing protein [Granulicella sibirica]|uniref:Dessication-associated protein n=1 Tax=Granulicella sibirica TaxID=2479048 RepID=A0A4Q0STR7_9BACT|nr:ferritin-like domain-containing protein [Granulicella sibirica]RXH54395.1 Dessication-associated protein [Granulicella sibirica]
MSRRDFLAGAGAGVVLTTGCNSSPVPTVTAPVTPTPATTTADQDLLNFALNLQYLEAEFYLRATTGQGLSSADIGASPGTVTGGTQVTFATPAVQEYALELANDELLHVRYLRKQLGSLAVDRPAIDLTGFSGFAATAGIATAFSPFTDENSFIVGAFLFEEVGVTAFHGAANLFTTRANATSLASMMAIEAYHSGLLRTLLAGLATPYPTYANQISTLRAKLGGGNETPVSALSIVAENNNCAVYERTTDQVLHILYATGAGVVARGGFFPDGVNGKITATAS